MSVIKEPKIIWLEVFAFFVLLPILLTFWVFTNIPLLLGKLVKSINFVQVKILKGGEY